LIWSSVNSENALTALAKAFQETPRRFFTEHDLHSHLYQIVEAELRKTGQLFCETLDKQTVSLVHHEYPTPFRCDMIKHDFVVADETKKTEKGGLFRRSHFDLVVLNPDFVKSNDLIVVAGKNYEEFGNVKSRIKAIPLLWACEVVFGSHYGDELPNNWAVHAIQDAKKLIETLKPQVGQNLRFAEHANIIVFLGTSPNDKTRQVEKQLKEFSKKNNFETTLVTMK
jgi:hypothetical protein